MRLYEFIISKGKLSLSHLRELKSKRGFTEDTITKNRLISGGKYLLEIEKELFSEFKQEELFESGICISDGKNIQISPTLLEDKIIIPYLDKNNECYYLRVHKLGLKGIPIEIYQLRNLTEKGIILTEGEFKAMAAQQLGIPAIAIPGISSFSDKHLPKLLGVLNENSVKEICVIFDNENKSDPKLPNYKENPAHRHDTQYYAYYMARILNKEGFRTRIGTLPESWQYKGKIDLDTALAQGKTKEDIQSVIEQSLDPTEYLKSLPSEVATLISKRMARRYFKESIKIEFNRYVATRRRGKSEWQEPISNFIVKIIATHETPEGIIREVVFVNQFGEYSSSFSLEAVDMSGVDSFKTFCLSKGNFIWRGNAEDLANIWEPLFLEDDGRHIIEPDHIGWIESEKMWLFGNVAVKGKEEMRPDKNHIFWTEKRGLKPLALGVTSGRMTISEGIPYLNLGESPSLTEIRSYLGETIGDMQANACLGWMAAVMFLEDVFDLYGCFPFLFITGRRGSGKSTIAEWLMNFYGLENAGKMAADTTPVGLQRYLAYYSSLPVFVDEYRNVKQVTYKNGFLRNVYNRQSAGKGIKSDFGVREAKIRGTLLISGEETPEDNALLTRCIVVAITEKSRKINHFNWFMANRIKFSVHVLNVLRNKDNHLQKFIKILNEGKEYMTGQKLDDRTAINYAIVAAGYAVLFGESVDFAKWITTEAQRVRQDYQKEQAVEVFLDDLIYLKTTKAINDEYWDVDGDKIYLYFHGLYNAWAKEYIKIRGEQAFKASSIRDYLKEETGYLDCHVNHRIGDGTKSCVVFDYDESPDNLKNLTAHTRTNCAQSQIDGNHND
ncbi:MAG: DUF3854 domain-containing protein [Clostridia bacterium]